MTESGEQFMAITWILVANASLARLYANLGPKKGLQLVKEIAHPESRMKNADLASDRAGKMQAAGSGHGAREQPPQNSTPPAPSPRCWQKSYIWDAATTSSAAPS
jgi:hypothetical protein